MTTGITIAQLAQDKALTLEEKIAKISFAVSGNSGMASQYATYKRNFKVQLDTIKEEFDKVANSTLLKSIEGVMELVLKSGEKVNTSAEGTPRMGIKVLRERAKGEREMLESIMADNKPLTDMFNLMQKSEAKMIGLANGTREETRLALIALDNHRKQAPQLQNRQQDEDDAIGMIEKVLEDVDNRRRAENDKREMRDFLQTGLSTDKPVVAPTRARFSRNMAKI